MDMISPGIYTQIVDLSTYLNTVSGTIGFVPIITDRGPDNVLTRVSGMSDYMAKFGEPDIRMFGKYYGQGPYVATQHLSVSDDLYVLRALPDDACYAHTYIAFADVESFPSDFSSSGEERENVLHPQKTTKLVAFSVQAGATYSVIGDKKDDVTYYKLDESKIDDAIAANDAFDKEFNPVEEANKKDAVYTKSENYAVKAKAPAMSSTQKLESIFDSTNQAIVEGSLPIGTTLHIEEGKTASDSILCYVRAIGRGDYYNDFSIKITSDANPQKFGQYSFQVYQKQDGMDVMVESFNVSFDPLALDQDGESMYIQDIVNKFSQYVVIEMNEAALDVMNKCMTDFYKNDPTIEAITTAYVEGDGFPNNVPACETETDADGVEIPKIINATQPSDVELGYKANCIWYAYFSVACAKAETIQAANAYAAAVALNDNDKNNDGLTRDEAIQEAVKNMTRAREMTDRAQEELTWAQSLNLMDLSDSDDTTIGEQAYPLGGGSLGGLTNGGKTNGKYSVNAVIGNQILSQAYTGLLQKPVVMKKEDPTTGNISYVTQYTSDVLDTDWIYFTIVYDAGYKSDVKQSALDLVDTYRRDCVLISDCGDNIDCNTVLQYVGYVKGGADVRSWNSYLAARYEPYSRVYDEYTGTDIWVSPVYHMAKLLPQTDALYNIWYAAAGFKRGMASDVKELRWSANKSERDQLYQAQVNPIVHFPEGMTVFGQLTTQKAASALSDLNCVRCMLYVKRAVEQYCRNFIFDHNDQTTWDTISTGISDLLAQVQANRGITSYSIDVGATDYEYKTKVCHVNVTIAPTKVLEKIQLNLYIQ